MNKSIARNNAIYELLKKYKGEDVKNKLSNGFIPDSLKSEFLEIYNRELIATKDQQDTDYDKSLFSSWFYIQSGKILGEEKEGSGYINPVKTIGKIDNIDEIIPFNVSVNNDVNKKSNSEKTVNVKMEEKTPSSEERKPTSSIKELSILKKIKQFEDKAPETVAEILSIEESLKIYSSQITDAEIKGFVYFKQKFGSPMFGWEKWFLPSKGLTGKICTSNKSFYLKDQQFKNVKLVPSNAVLGIKTKFKNEYDGKLYWVIKTDKNELYYAEEDNFVETSSYSTVDESELIKLVKEKGLCYDGNDYVPVFMFTYGDIYELKERFIGKYNRETDKFEGGFKDEVERLFGVESMKWHESIIENALKNKSNFDFSNPVVSERPYLAKENDLSHSFIIRELNIDSGVSFKKHFDDINSTKRRGSKIEYIEGETSFTLFEAYEIWFGYSVNDMMLEKTSVSDIKNLYFKNGNVFLSDESKDKTKTEQEKEKDEKRILAKIEGDKFYSEFLATALTKHDLIALNLSFNRQFNNFISIDLSKVPVGFEANNKVFNLNNFRLKPVQRDGLAFLSVNSSGCLAYDVGFGKTLTAIHNLAMLLKQGSVKRPLIAVPKQVYKNWIYEMFGFWTNGSEKNTKEFKNSYFVNGALTGSKYKLNDWFNLGTNRAVENKEVPEYTITLVTYQGLEKIGFSEKLHAELGSEMYQILNAKEIERTERQAEKDKEKSEAMLGRALAKTELDIDVLNFDYLVADEAHAFKNIFSSFAIPEDFRNSWRMPKGTQSTRALKLFTLSLYIQKRFNGNVNLLTATPFTNSPLELYSMLSLVAYNYLITSKINNLFNFMSMFIETQVEYTVDHLQNIVLNTVIKSFKNKNILRDMLYRYFDYQDNPVLAGVKRPCKINFPNANVSTFLQMSDTQLMAQEMVREEADSYDPATNRGAMGRALSWAKSNSFSPYLIPNIDMYADIDEFIEESPKLKYTIECIKSVKNYHAKLGQECSGQVIYSNRGKDLFKDFKKALEKHCDFSKKVAFGDDFVDEVEIITSSNSEADSDRKELIKDAFNEGYVKVIIGTATIQEGINLQKRGTVLYNLDLDWNPTAFKQLEGRIHRQGNMFKYVRIVVPMIQDTLDSFINQKLDEKSKRIASIWDKDNKLNEYSVSDAIDPMEIKFNLIKDERKLMAMKLDMTIEKAKKDFLINEDKFNAFSDLTSAVENFNYYNKKVVDTLDTTIKNYTEYLMYIDKLMDSDYIPSEYKKLSENVKKVEGLKEKITETLDLYYDFKNNNNYKSLFEFKRACTSRKFEASIKLGYNDTFEITYNALVRKMANKYGSYYLNEFNEWSFNSLLGAYGDAKRLEKSLLKPYALTMFDDFSELKGSYMENYEKSKNNLEYIKSDDYQNVIRAEVRAELEKRQGEIGDLFDRVEAFEKSNNLLTYPFVESEADNCSIPEEADKISKTYLQDELDVLEHIENEGMDEKVLRKKLKKIQDFLNPSQLSIVKKSILEFADVITNLFAIIQASPVTYETDNIERDEKIVQLHYFTGNSDFYIIELDKGDKEDEDENMQSQAFGYTILNGDREMAELGYINIDEVKKYAELDFYFTPVKLGTIINVEEKSPETPEEKEWKEAIDTLKMLIDTESGDKKQIAEWYEAIDTLNFLIDNK